jgi:hypothetical protein
VLDLRKKEPDVYADLEAETDDTPPPFAVPATAAPPPPPAP